MRGTIRFSTAWVPAVLVAWAASWTNAQHGSGDESRIRFAIGMLQKMDADRDGQLKPHEISDRARPYVASYAQVARLDMSQPMSVRQLSEAVGQYYRNRSAHGSSDPGRSTPSLAAGDPTVPGFGQVEDSPPIPGFGTDVEPSIKVEKDDLEKTDYTFRRYDRNHDGFLDRDEIRAGRWSDDPLQYDRNRDGRISQQEMAERYAIRRINSSGGSNPPSSSSGRSQSDHAGQSESRPISEEERRRRAEEERRRAEEERRRKYAAIGRENWALAATLSERYDSDRNGSLDRGEWRNMGLTSMAADTDGDDRVNRVELAVWLAGQANKSGQRLLRGLPDWFAQRDANGDGQVAMVEFAEEWTEAKASEFDRYDLNRDGIIMPEECLKATSVPAGTHASHEFQVIPTRGTIYSDIVVRDTEPVGDLNVQISITHTHDSYLDVFLIGPDEERIELFTGVGGEDDHFQNTILDDEAMRSITEGRPPFSGTYRPEAVRKQLPSLRHYYGKEISGTWTLQIRAERSDRPGALHGWSLIADPAAAAKPPVETRSPDQPGPPAEAGPPPEREYRRPMSPPGGHRPSYDRRPPERGSYDRDGRGYERRDR